jgi:hypothetical protein
MDLRIVLPIVLLAGCVPASSRRSPSYEEVTAREPIDAITPEARARLALSELEAFCGPRADECGAYEHPDTYPELDVPRTTAEFIDARTQQIRSLGFIARWDPGTDRYELGPGNSPSWNGDLSSDPDR